MIYACFRFGVRLLALIVLGRRLCIEGMSNIPRGGLVACRVPTDLLIVCGVSNWGAYGLAAGIRLLRGTPPAPDLFDPERERDLLRVMVERGPLVDGTSGQPTITVDGLSFERYIEPLIKMGQL